MKKSLMLTGAFVLWLGATGAIAYAVHAHRHDIKNELASVSDLKNGFLDFTAETKNSLFQKTASINGDVRAFGNSTVQTFTDVRDNTIDGIKDAWSGTGRKISAVWQDVTDPIQESWDNIIRFAFSFLEVDETPERPQRPAFASADNAAHMIDVSFDGNIPPPPLTLTEMKRRSDEDMAASIMPAAGPSWEPDQSSLNVEAVLVPRQITVISSSQDGRIADIFVGHGDTFKKGNLLIAYDCADLEAEADIVRIQQDLTKRKVQGSDKLFKLDIISDLDRLGAQVEDKQAMAKAKLYEARLNDCQIRAGFDGRVTNRLANPGEYTRTDRVLLEVASNEPLQAEFLVPSKWLRWVNTGAPVSITIGETEQTYTARIQRIHGEVDPVSQSIQMIATLDPYNDPLLPGMSGQATIDVNSIRAAGVRGYLEANQTP
jgi:membrane fusion protein (multidrug efflux system)